MRKAIFLILVLSLILVIGCEKPTATINQKQELCENSCDEVSLRDSINRYFGFNSDEYSIKCSKCMWGRGGHIKAVIEKEGQESELYYQWGWCSSSGADCGWEMCFKSEKNEKLYDSVKDKFCNKVSHYLRSEEQMSLCSKEGAFDNTTNIQAVCFDGAFESVAENTKSISIDQYIGRCSAKANKMEIDCFENYP